MADDQIIKTGKSAAMVAINVLAEQLESVNKMCVNHVFLPMMVKNIGMQEASQEEAVAYCQDINTLLGDLRDQTKNLLQTTRTCVEQETYEFDEK